MKIALIIIRTLMGLFLLFASVSYFFNLMKVPAVMPEPVLIYNKGIAVAHILTIVKSIELICGLLLVMGRFATLATVVIFPITINIILFHAYADPANIGGGILLLALNLFMAYYYRKNYVSLFSVK
ncbi:DoxX family protein [Mucilaginibacter sp. RB4R14]|uniref:DoxX family protein n=1 Tax=Mucilaginibacter aurantiaciroseus TaxID=2949308 RepID=UPI002091242D|nr:DoxX family protein [Mucilaginibacter aurantiaciroseus]MCO5936936.1 DoxX family protein [Mucilaginibacter aurantiaciroseus]